MLSVITLVRNRNRMLRNLCASLAAQTSESFELIVVDAGGHEDPADVTSRFAFDVHPVCGRPSGDGADDERIDYSGARNLGALRSSGQSLLFVDADTMLGPRTIEAMTEALRAVDALCTGDLRYLPPHHEDFATSSFSELGCRARRHPARPCTPHEGMRLGADHALVWGLNMGLRRSTFDRVGGFDSAYLGYAGEDTDLGRSLAELGVPTAFVAGVEILHQHHDSFEPPLQQFRATLANAQRFHDKWGDWPMRGWLDAFEHLGLISRFDDAIEVVRDPTLAEVEATRCTLAAPFRSTHST